MEIGKINSLRVVKMVDFGVYLDGEEAGEILMPKRYVPANCLVDDFLEVFVYTDSEDRLVATTEQATVQVGQFALLEVVDVHGVGAFLKWVPSKDLLLPFSEQKRDVEVGDKVFVYAYLDQKTQRVVASAKWEKFTETDTQALQLGQSVSLQIAGITDLGYKAVVDGRFTGLLYKNQVFHSLHIGDTLPGFVKLVREDGKLDLQLEAFGYNKVSPSADVVLRKLSLSGGFLPTTDKSPAEEIYARYGMSKKTYKQAVGMLYKQGKISLDADGIRLK